MKQLTSIRFFISLLLTTSYLVNGSAQAQAPKPAPKPAAAPHTTTAAKPTTPPKIVSAFGAVKVDKGAKFTTNAMKKVALEIALQRGEPTRYKMMVSNEPGFAGKAWEKFAPNKAWELEGEDGLKTIFVKFQDPAGNESEAISTSITLDRTPPSNCKLTINEDAQYVTDKTLKVKLKIDAKDAKVMRISNSPSFTGNAFENYAPAKDFTLAPPNVGEGRRTVYAQFKDEAGNISETVTDTIRLDTKEPATGSVKIAIGPNIKNDMGKLICNAKDKKITINITTVGATKMSIVQDVMSSAPAPSAPAGGKATPPAKAASSSSVVKKVESVEPYATVKEITLDGEDGVKTIKVFFIDDAGNKTTIPATATIVLDRQGPNLGALKIDEGKEYCINPHKKANLKIEAKGEPFQMMISNKPDFAGATWEGYVATKNQWTLEGEDGEKTVFIKFKDKADNESEIFSDKIILDTKPPLVNKFVADHDSAYTTNPSAKVTVQIDATDAELMMISKDPLNPATFAGQATLSPNWKKYANTAEVQLDSYEGEKTVYALFRDKAGNISKLATDKITLDKLPPTLPKMIIEDNAPWVTNAEKKVKLTLSAEQGPAYMMISNNDKFTGAKWEHFATIHKDWILDGEDGEKTVFCKFKDKAGNTTAVISAKTKMDRKAPTDPKVVINNDSLYTHSVEKRVNLKISAKDATQMRISQNKNFPPATQGWEPYNAAKTITLEGGDGSKSVYIQFRDPAGNISPTATDSIRLDRTPPIPGTLVIDDGAEFTNNKEKKVNLKFSATGAKEMMISSSSTFSGAKWEPYSPTKANYVLDGNDDGPRILYVRFRDEAGNTSTPAIQGTIKLKRKF